MTQLKVIYQGDINTHLDQEIEKVVGAFGYVRLDSGYNLINNERDLAFELCGEKLIDSEGDPVFRMKPSTGGGP